MGARSRRVFGALVLVVAACSPGASPETTPPAPAVPVSSTVVELPIAGGLITEAVLAEATSRIPVVDGQGGVLVAVYDTTGAAVASARGSGPDGKPPTLEDAFRIGSITKVFTSVLTLALVDAGMIGLDDIAADHLPQWAIPRDVMVRDLLQHTSGIPDFVSAGWDSAIAQDRGRVWSAASTLELVDLTARVPTHASGFAYSSTNHLLLGLLIEEVTGRPFATELRERILEPHGLTHTYLEGYEAGPPPFAGYVGSIDFDWTSTATSSWSAGGMVSSAEDLHTLLSGVFGGSILSPGSATAMIDPLVSMDETAGYGLGIAQLRTDQHVYGHGGRIHGYDALVAHIPDLGVTVFGVATNHLWPISPAVAAVIGHLVGDPAPAEPDTATRDGCTERDGILREARGFVCPPRMVAAFRIRQGHPFNFSTEAGYLAGTYAVDEIQPHFEFTRSERFRAGGADHVGFVNLDVVSSESCDRCRRMVDIVGDRLASILREVDWTALGYVSDVRRDEVAWRGEHVAQIDVTIEEGACTAAWCTLTLVDELDWNWATPQRVRIIDLEAVSAAVIVSAHPDRFDSYWAEVGRPILDSLAFEN